jgi:tetratricopeptide (TPR) repeat protein
VRVVALVEEARGPDHADVAVALSNLALFYKAIGRFAEARPAYERALAILESSLGPAHPQVGIVLHNLAQLLRAQAGAMEARSKRIEAAAAEVADPEVLARTATRVERARFALEIRPSRIHRFGVFAAEPIPADVAILEYTGERISRREAVRRWNADRTYLLKLDSYWRLDGSTRGSGAELINHSCAPNCRFRIRDGRAWVEALGPIARGEELLLDYAFSAESERIECYCGAPTCRGTINARTRRRGATRS